VQVTATRIPENASDVPAAIDVISGDDLRDRGATDLRSALALASGVTVAPGGDGGPASSVPEFWGLKEFDAFLLVVDGVPWGGAFNPALASLDLNNVERIEVQRGSAPVMYGATSFVGVVQVIHKQPADTENALSLFGGSFSSGGGAFSAKLGHWSGWDSAVSGDFTRLGFKDDRESYQKGHLLWRNRHNSGASAWRFDLDATILRQDPASPHPREGKTLSAAVPLDANHNPSDAHLDEDRFFGTLGYDHATSFGSWNTVVSYTHSGQNQVRGFLAGISESAPNARGLRAEIDQNDIYFDSHVAFTAKGKVRGVAGIDYLYGKGSAEGDVFDYFVHLDGEGAPDSATIPMGDERRIEDKRNFAGAYGFVEWKPQEKLSLEAGLRLNRTEEERGGEEDMAASAGEAEAKKEVFRPSGSLAVAYTAWEQGADRVRLFAVYKNAFKPAAADFNVAESEPAGGESILEPETAQSYELGVKSRFGKVEFEISSFLMDFDNLVISQVVNGLPGLENAGTERFKGIETTLEYRPRAELGIRATYALHDARFQDFLTEFDGEPTQLGGKRLEMSAHHLASGGLVWMPKRGFLATVDGNYLSSFYLNKRNTALADGYFTWSASAGYRTEKLEFRVAGRNLNDRRDPVSESELGDAQYYRLEARRFDATVSIRF
jgi:outer membrane receptor protein involved in Fe transport